MNTMFLCCLYVFLMPSLWIFSFFFVLFYSNFFLLLFYLTYYYSFGTYLFFFMKNRKGMDPGGRGREKELGWLRGSKNIIKIQQIKKSIFN